MNILSKISCITLSFLLAQSISGMNRTEPNVFETIHSRAVALNSVIQKHIASHAKNPYSDGTVTYLDLSRFYLVKFDQLVKTAQKKKIALDAHLIEKTRKQLVANQDNLAQYLKLIPVRRNDTNFFLDEVVFFKECARSLTKKNR